MSPPDGTAPESGGTASDPLGNTPNPVFPAPDPGGTATDPDGSPPNPDPYPSDTGGTATDPDGSPPNPDPYPSDPDGSPPNPDPYPSDPGAYVHASFTSKAGRKRGSTSKSKSKTEPKRGSTSKSKSKIGPKRGSTPKAVTSKKEPSVVLPFRIFIGYDSSFPEAYEVCRYSLIVNSSIDLEISPIDQQDLRLFDIYDREPDPTESTEFSRTRFLTPFLAGYHSWAMYTDPDFLYTGDVAELVQIMDDKFALMCVKFKGYMGMEISKMGGKVQTVYPRKHWSSLVLYNCSHPRHKFLTPKFVSTCPAAILHRFFWLKPTLESQLYSTRGAVCHGPLWWRGDDKLIRDIPKAALEDDGLIGAINGKWNHLVGYSKLEERTPKGIHFTLGGPWMEEYAVCNYAGNWREMRDAYNNNSAARLQEELEREASLKNLTWELPELATWSNKGKRTKGRFSRFRIDDDCMLEAEEGSDHEKGKGKEKVDEKERVSDDDGDVVVDDDGDPDWLPPRSQFASTSSRFQYDKTSQELSVRLKKQELTSDTESIEKLLKEVSMKREFNNSATPFVDDEVDKPPKQKAERQKIAISIQDKDGQNQFQLYKDDKFERIFKTYADKVKLALDRLVFSFDGDKVGLDATPDGLDMEDDDMVDVHVKSL